jgi:DNA-binding CsgD family transcriptional regulator
MANCQHEPRTRDHDHGSPVRRPRDAAGSQLSDREAEVLRLTAEGYSNTEIGARLYLSPKTVDTYRQRIMEKLGLHHRAELVRHALDSGLWRARA